MSGMTMFAEEAQTLKLQIVDLQEQFSRLERDKTRLAEQLRAAKQLAEHAVEKMQLAEQEMAHLRLRLRDQLGLRDAAMSVIEPLKRVDVEIGTLGSRFDQILAELEQLSRIGEAFQRAEKTLRESSRDAGTPASTASPGSKAASVLGTGDNVHTQVNAPEGA